ncbi:MAG: CoA transferase [SAR202 cluster bacterium]|nr:CoA transferase [SAR202 cluster bacterium]
MTVLAGLRVLDFTEYIAGPYGGMLLGDMGADVIKVEPPGGDRWRQGVFYAPHETRNNLSMNRSKRGIAIDLATDDGQKIIHKMVRRSDVVMHNFRPGVAERLGIDYDTLSALNPSLVYCHNTAFGTRGPLANKGGYDILSMAATGFLTGPAGRIEQGKLIAAMGIPVADISSSIFQALAICAALWNRERTGRGQKIDTSLLGAGIAVQATRMTSVEETDRPRRDQFLANLREHSGAATSLTDLIENRIPEGQLAHGNFYFRAYETADRPIAVACLNDRLRRRCAEVIGFSDPRQDDSDFNPEAEGSVDVLKRIAVQVEDIMRTKTFAEWTAVFDEADVPCGPIKFIEELFDDPQALANDLVVEVDHTTLGPIKMAGAPFDFHGTPLNIHRASPGIGEHADELLSEFGYSDDEIRLLREGNIIV